MTLWQSYGVEWCMPSAFDVHPTCSNVCCRPVRSVFEGLVPGIGTKKPGCLDGCRSAKRHSAVLIVEHLPLFKTHRGFQCCFCAFKCAQMCCKASLIYPVQSTMCTYFLPICPFTDNTVGALLSAQTWKLD